METAAAGTAADETAAAADEAAAGIALKQSHQHMRQAVDAAEGETATSGEVLADGTHHSELPGLSLRRLQLFCREIILLRESIYPNLQPPLHSQPNSDPLCLCYSLSCSHSHSLTHSLSVYRYLYLTHTNTFSHSLSHTNTFSLTLCLSISLSDWQQ